MGKAGQSLKRVLELYGISQSQLASELGVDRSVVFRWFHEQIDPTAETVVEIVQAIREIDLLASREFIQLYLGDITDIDQSDFPMQTYRSMQIYQLPPSNTLNIPALAGLFKKTTTSYKYLYFISLLDILKRRNFEILSPISFNEIIVEMLANAWYPHIYFKLSFGTQDQITKKLDSLILEIGESIIKSNDIDKQVLRKTIKSKFLDNIINDLKKMILFMI